MLEYGDTTYIIDLAALDKAITIYSGLEGKVVTDKTTLNSYDAAGDLIGYEVNESSTRQTKEIDGAKYDLLKTFIEYLMEYTNDADTTLGAERALDKSSLGFKIVFNTLLNEGIIKEKD